MKEMNFSELQQLILQNTAGIQALEQTIIAQEVQKVAGSSNDPNQVSMKDLVRNMNALMLALQRAGFKKEEVKAVGKVYQEGAATSVRSGMIVSDKDLALFAARVVNEAVRNKTLTVTNKMASKSYIAKDIKEDYKKDVIRQADSKGLKNVAEKIQYFLEGWRQDQDSKEPKQRKKFIDDLLDGLSKNKGIMGVVTDIVKLITLLGASWLKKFGTLGNILGTALIFAGPSIAKFLWDVISRGIGPLVGGLLRGLGRALPFLGAAGAGFGAYNAFQKGDVAGVTGYGIGALAFALAPFLGPGAPIAIGIGAISTAIGAFHTQIGQMLETFFPSIKEKFEGLIKGIRVIISTLPGGRKLLKQIDKVTAQLEKNREASQKAQNSYNVAGFNSPFNSETNAKYNPNSKIVKEYEQASSKRKSVADKVRAEAIRQGVDPDLAMSLAYQESGWNQGARSKVGAIGVMQLMPSTAKTLGVNPFNEDENIRGGVTNLKNALAHYGGRIEPALAAYNAGFGAVDAFLYGKHYKQRNGKEGNPSLRSNFEIWNPEHRRKAGWTKQFKETENYVSSIMSLYTATQQAPITSPSTSKAAANIPGVAIPEDTNAKNDNKDEDYSALTQEEQNMEAEKFRLSLVEAEEDRKDRYDAAVQARKLFKAYKNKAISKEFLESKLQDLEDPDYYLGPFTTPEKGLKRAEENIKKYTDIVPGYWDYDPTGNKLTSRMFTGTGDGAVLGSSDFTRGVP